LSKIIEPMITMTDKVFFFRMDFHFLWDH